MSHVTDKLRLLCDPKAEAMPDGHRLTEFVQVGLEAADEIERLRAALEVAANDLQDFGAYTKANKVWKILEAKDE